MLAAIAALAMFAAITVFVQRYPVPIEKVLREGEAPDEPSSSVSVPVSPCESVPVLSRYEEGFRAGALFGHFAGRQGLTWAQTLFCITNKVDSTTP